MSNPSRETDPLKAYLLSPPSGWLVEARRVSSENMARYCVTMSNRWTRITSIVLVKKTLKVVGNEKVGGSRMCQTVPIWLGPRQSMFFTLINFAVVFDFMYFRFRPSKAKWIGDVLTNRQNATNYLQRFFIWSYYQNAADPAHLHNTAPPYIYESLCQWD